MAKRESNRQPKKRRLFVRNAQLSDIEAIIELTTRVYPEMPPYKDFQLRGQIWNVDGGLAGLKAPARRKAAATA